MTTHTAARARNHPLALEGTRPVVVGGLLVGAVLGFAGNFVESGAVQSLMYGVSAVGLIVGSVLLAMAHLSTGGSRLAAAGFALLALGETRVLNPVHTPSGEDAFAAGVFLYAPGLLLLALAPWAPRWVRIVGALTAVPFAAHAVIRFAGGEITSTGPLAGAGYALFTITVVGWILTVLRSDEAVTLGR